MAEETYDICLSYASRNRRYVKRVAAALTSNGLRVFYDQKERSRMAGGNLISLLRRIYRNAKHCVAFLSAAYARSEWTEIELNAAHERALKEPGYLVLGRFDKTEFDSILNTAQYTDLNDTSAEEFAEILIGKIREGYTPPPKSWRRRFSDFRWRHRIKLRVAAIALAAFASWVTATAVTAPAIALVPQSDAEVVVLRVTARWRPLRVERGLLTFSETLPIESATLVPVKDSVVGPLQTEQIQFALSEGELIVKNGLQESQIQALIPKAQATIEVHARDGDASITRRDSFSAGDIQRFIERWVPDYVP